MTSAAGQRPYAKYVGDGRTNIHGILTNGHPMAYENSLFYFRYEGEEPYDADGVRIGRLASRAAARSASSTASTSTPTRAAAPGATTSR